MRLRHVLRILALGLPLAALLSTSCLARYCTLAQFYGGLSVDIRLPAGAAVYRVEVAAEAETLALRFDVDTDRASGSCASQCLIEGERISLRGTPTIGVDIRELRMIVSTDFEKNGPREATFRVYRNDVLVAEQTFQPRYTTDEPNGEGCGERTFAMASMDVL